jgi:hypothetical protein
MKNFLRPTLAGLALVAVLATATALPARADGASSTRNIITGIAALAAVAAIVDANSGQQQYNDGYGNGYYGNGYNDNVYYQPQPVYYQSQPNYNYGRQRNVRPANNGYANRGNGGSWSHNGNGNHAGAPATNRGHGSGGNQGRHR